MKAAIKATFCQIFNRRRMFRFFDIASPFAFPRTSVFSFQ
jgi:hypothetical protein